MSVQSEITFLSEVAGILNKQGFDGLARCMEILINEAMFIERQQVIGVRHYERSESRKGQANGFLVIFTLIHN